MRRLLLSPLLMFSAVAHARTAELISDPAKAKMVAGAGEAVVVAMIDGLNASGANSIGWQLYDINQRKLINAAPAGFKDYAVQLNYSTRLSNPSRYIAYVGVIPAGDYVLALHRTDFLTNTFCFGAPVVHIAVGSVSYIGTFRVFNREIFPNPQQHDALGWSDDISKAREAVAAFSDLKNKLQTAPIYNGATFACSGDAMWAYRVPNAPDLPATTNH